MAISEKYERQQLEGLLLKPTTPPLMYQKKCGTGQHLKMGSSVLCALRDEKRPRRRQGGTEIGL